MSAPVGKTVNLSLTTYASATSTDPLATGSQRLQVFAGTNYVSASLLGLAQRVVTRLIPDTLRQGHYAHVPVVAYGVDAAGKAIPGQLANVAQLDVLLSGFFNANVSQICDNYDYCEPLYCCGVATTFDYDGLATGTETIRTTSTISYNPTTTSVKVRPGSSQLATLLVGADTDTGFLNLQFAAGASGNAAPVRTVEVGSPLYGEDAAGNYWANTTRYSSLGTVLGTITLPGQLRPVAADAQGHIYARGQNCGFTEFPANAYGIVSPIRSVTCSGPNYVSPAIDDAGNVYVTGPNPNGTATILEYPPTGSGNLPPIRKLSSPTFTYASFESLACDGSGNLYGLLYAGNVGYELLEFAPGATTGQQILANVPLSSFTVDDAGDTFAVIYDQIAAASTIEEFPPGATTPSVTIGGSKTGMTKVAADQIVVPR